MVSVGRGLGWTPLPQLLLLCSLLLPGPHRPCCRHPAPSWRDSFLSLGVPAVVLQTLGDFHIPWRHLFNLHLQCSVSWTQVVNGPQRGDGGACNPRCCGGPQVWGGASRAVPKSSSDPRTPPSSQMPRGLQMSLSSVLVGGLQSTEGTRPARGHAA